MRKILLLRACNLIFMRKSRVAVVCGMKFATERTRGGAPAADGVAHPTMLSGVGAASLKAQTYA